MSQSTPSSFEERLRARINGRGIDVPVFTQAFHQSTPVLRGDPGRGQTPVSPQRTGLYEDPSLIVPRISSDTLVLHLRHLQQTNLAPDLPELKTNSLKREATGGVEIATPDWRPRPYQAIKNGHRIWVQLASFLFFCFGYVLALHLPHKFLQRIVRNILKTWSDLIFFCSLFLTIFTLMGDIAILGTKKTIHLPTGRQVRLSGMPELLRMTLHAPKIAVPKISIALLVRVLPAVSMSVPKIVLPHFSIRLPRFAFPTVSVRVPTLALRFNYHRLMGIAGHAMIVASIVLFLMTGGPIIRLQVGDWWQQSRAVLTGKAQEPAVKETLTDTVRKPDEVPPPEKQFQLEIPKIGANLRVIANVDAGDEKAYTEALKLGVAHAAGSGLPGEANVTNRTIYIFGHSTNAVWNIEKYNALFYSLKDMVIGDDISVWFWGKEFHYKVTNVVKIDPSDLTYLAPQTVKDQLILQTCWPPGTVWKRLLVIAEPVAK